MKPFSWRRVNRGQDLSKCEELYYSAYENSEPKKLLLLQMAVCVRWDLTFWLGRSTARSLYTWLKLLLRSVWHCAFVIWKPYSYVELLLYKFKLLWNCLTACNNIHKLPLCFKNFVPHYIRICIASTFTVNNFHCTVPHVHSHTHSPIKYK